MILQICYFGNPEHHRKRFIWISSTNNFQKIVTVTKVFVKQLQFFWVSLFSYGMCFSLFHLSGPNFFLLSAIWLPHSQLWATVKGSLTSLRLISVLLVSTRSQGALQQGWVLKTRQAPYGIELGNFWIWM